MADEQTNWFLQIRTHDDEYSYCCMSKEKAMQTLIDEVYRLAGEVVEAELKHPNGQLERLPLA